MNSATLVGWTSETCAECMGLTLYLMLNFSFWPDVVTGAGRRGGGRSGPLPFRITPIQRRPVRRWVVRAPAACGGRHEISYNLTSVGMTFYKAQKVSGRQQWSQPHRDSKRTTGRWEHPMLFFSFIYKLNWTEMNLALWLWCCCCIINTHFSLPRRWLLFCYDDGFSGERCSDLSKFGREQSCPAHSQIRLEMATGWVAWPGSNTCQGCVLFIHLKWMWNFIFCVCVCLEPHFLHAIEYGNYVYFFLSEIAVEYTTLGKVRPTHFSRTRTLWF